MEQPRLLNQQSAEQTAESGQNLKLYTTGKHRVCTEAVDRQKQLRINTCLMKLARGSSIFTTTHGKKNCYYLLVYKRTKILSTNLVLPEFQKEQTLSPWRPNTPKQPAPSRLGTSADSGQWGRSIPTNTTIQHWWSTGHHMYEGTVKRKERNNVEEQVRREWWTCYLNYGLWFYTLNQLPWDGQKQLQGTLKRGVGLNLHTRPNSLNCWCVCSLYFCQLAWFTASERHMRQHSRRLQLSSQGHVYNASRNHILTNT